jgi:hypothetical protein
MAQSPEMETLDQLLGGEMRLTIIRQLYDSDQSFTRGTHRLLQSGDVRLLDDSHSEFHSGVGARCSMTAKCFQRCSRSCST